MKCFFSFSLVVAMSLLLASCGREHTTSGVGATELEIARGGSTNSASSDGGGSPCNWTFIESKTRKEYKYHKVPLHKALAVTPDQATGYAAWGRSTKRNAKTSALRECKLNNATTCRIFDIDGNVCDKSSGRALKVITPNGGELWKPRKSYTIRWNKGNAGKFVKIRLLKSGKAYKWISKKTKNDGKHRWKVPSSVAVGSAYKIRVQSVTKSRLQDNSDSNFTISKNSPTGGSKAYRDLNRHNAYALDGHTVRWASKTILVSGAKGPWRKAVNRWTKATNVKFKYVASLAGRKGIQIVGHTNGGWSGNICGMAGYRYRSSGHIVACKVTMNPSSDCRQYEVEQNIMTHEIGHCIGLFKHTSDGGLMDRIVRNHVFTSTVRNMINLLYSLKPGTNINSKLARRPPAGMRGSRPSKYDPAGGKLYSGTSYFMKNGDIVLVEDQ